MIRIVLEAWSALALLSGAAFVMLGLSIWPRLEPGDALLASVVVGFHIIGMLCLFCLICDPQ
jgi:hypothetical protein